VITSVHVLSYNEMEQAMMHNRLPENAFVVSILEPGAEPIFEEETDWIITVVFHDIDPAGLDLQPGDDPKEYGFTIFDEAQAKQIATHVFKYLDAPEEYVLYVHCRAGISRSGAVGTFTQRAAGLDYDAFKRQNRRIMPNAHVLSLLMRELRNRDADDA
jgi:predicted protein tyrosine phosphatase